MPEATLKHLRIEGIAAIEVMRTAHNQGNHMLALEHALRYARIIRRIAAKAEEEIAGSIQPTVYDPQADEAYGDYKTDEEVKEHAAL